MLNPSAVYAPGSSGSANPTDPSGAVQVGPVAVPDIPVTGPISLAGWRLTLPIDRSGALTGKAQQLQTAVAEVVARQRDVGIDIVNDGEFGHAMASSYDYGPWWTYAWPRFSGLELEEHPLWGALPPQTRPQEHADGEVVLASFAERRD